MSDVLIAGLELQNLSESAGYQQFAKLLPFDCVNSNKFLFYKAEFGTQRKRINLFCYESYLKMIAGKYKLIHYLYPELHLTFSLPINTKTISIGTVHLPMNAFQVEHLKNVDWVMNQRKKQFDRFDSIVTLTKSNIADIKKTFPNAEVKYIPHGVYDLSSYYTEKKEKESVFNIVMSGSNFRDFEITKALLEYAIQNKPQWKFHILGISKKKTALQGFSNVNIYPYLEEKLYLDLLAKSDIHYLPLTFATANNAMLEAHSVGTPTLVSDLESVKDYSLSTTRYFKDIDSLIFEISDLESLSCTAFNEIKRKTLEESSRFHWEQIANEYDMYYRYLLKQ